MARAEAQMNYTSLTKKSWDFDTVAEDEHPKFQQEQDPLYLYLKQISRYPLLSADEEKYIAQQIAELKRTLANLKSQREKKEIHPVKYSNMRSKL